MKINDAVTWHAFTYSQLYPAVLGSMLYDILHFPSSWNPTDVIKWSITIFYCLDYLNLYSNIKAFDPRNRKGSDILIDALVAILLGISYWFAFDGNKVVTYCIFVAVTFLFFIYYLRGPRKSTKNLASMAVLFILAILAARFHLSNGQEVWLMILYAVLPVIAYGIYVFSLSNTLQLRQHRE
jgi:hypothetical protein